MDQYQATWYQLSYPEITLRLGKVALGWAENGEQNAFQLNGLGAEELPRRHTITTELWRLVSISRGGKSPMSTILILQL